jgi:hypothetical protein
MLNRRFLEFLGLLEKHHVEHLDVGGYAVGMHGFPHGRSGCLGRHQPHQRRCSRDGIKGLPCESFASPRGSLLRVARFVRSGIEALRPWSHDQGYHAEFEFGSLGLKPESFLETDTIVEIGREPIKLQVLTGIDGVTFDGLRPMDSDSVKCKDGQRWAECCLRRDRNVVRRMADTVVRPPKIGPKAMDRRPRI